MKKIVLAIVMTHAVVFSAVTDQQKKIFQMFNSSGDLTLKSDGSVAVEYPQNYSLRVSVESGHNVITASPKGPGQSSRETLYFLSKAGSLRSAFKVEKRKGFTLYSSFESQQIPELKNPAGETLFKGIDLGTYTLICEDYKKDGFNPEIDKLCVVANSHNCNNFYGSMERAGLKLDRTTLASCNMMFNMVFSNAQISKAHSKGVPKSLYFSGATEDTEKLTGQRLSFYPYGPEEREAHGTDKILDYLSYFFEACESYRAGAARISGASSGRR